MAAIVFAATCLAFAPTLANGFVDAYDDGINFLRNGAFRGLGLAQVRWAWQTDLLGVYQPLSWLLLESEYSAWGLNPSGYHAASVLLHALVAAALLALTIALLDRMAPQTLRANRFAALFGTLVFALHPLRVEVVAWASCQPYMPCYLFAVLTALAYLRGHPPNGPTRPVWVVAAWLLYAVALLFRGNAVTLSLVLIILDAYPLCRLRRGKELWRNLSSRRALLEKLPFLALSVGFLEAAMYAKRHGVVVRPLPDGIAARLAQASYAACFTLIKTVWPGGLSAHYPLPEHPYAFSAPFVAATLAIVAVTAALVWRSRAQPGLAAVWAVYLVTLAPHSGIFRTNDQVATDRYSYVPAMAISVAFAFALSRIGARASRWPVIVTTGVAVCLALTVLTWRQCRTWRDNLALYSRVVAAASHPSARARVNLGFALEQQGRLAEAEHEYNIARQIDPGLALPLNNLGNLRLRAERFAEAKDYYTRALDADPRFVEAYNNMGLVEANQGRPAAAIAWYERALILNPSVADIRLNLAKALHKLGREDEALHYYSGTLRLDPDNAAARQGVNELQSRHDARLRLFRR